MGIINRFKETCAEVCANDPALQASYDLSLYGENAPEAEKLIKRIKRHGTVLVLKMVGVGAVGFGISEALGHSLGQSIVLGSLALSGYAIYKEESDNGLFHELNQLREPSTPPENNLE